MKGMDDMYKPILFNTEMVNAILDGRKTQTRRLVKGRKSDAALCTPCSAGDVLWVRETYCPAFYDRCFYKAGSTNEDIETLDQLGYRWKPSIHMPKEAARIFLRVKNVYVEQLQSIDGMKVLAEGVDNGGSNPAMGNRWENMQRMAFAHLWDSTIKRADIDKYGWRANPWVWVIEFERCEMPEDFLDAR